MANIFDENVFKTDESIVDNVFKNHKNLIHIKDKVLNTIASLDYSMLKELATESILDLLNEYNKIELYKEKINKHKPTNSPFPRSIRLNIELTCSEKSTRETEIFQALRKEAELATLAYQQKMRQSIVKTMELDKGTVTTTLQDTFFSRTTVMIEKQVFYECKLISPDASFSKTINTHGGAKTAAGYMCNEIFLLAKDGLAHPLFTPLCEMERYLSLEKQVIINRILNCFNKDKVDKVKASYLLNNNTYELAIREHVLNILMFCMTKMTTGFFEDYMVEIRMRNAIAETKATFDAKETTVVTKNVTEALADEGTMSAQRMEDYVNKKVDTKIEKSLNAKLEKQLDAMQKTINDMAKNSSGGRQNKGQTKKSASAKKRNKNKGKKRNMEEMNESESNDNDNNGVISISSDSSDDDSSNESGSNSSSSQGSSNSSQSKSKSDNSVNSKQKHLQSTRKKLKFKDTPKPSKKNQKKKKSKNLSWHRTPKSSKKSKNQKGKGNQGESQKGKGKKGKQG
jgi:hypothetical protein